MNLAGCHFTYADTSSRLYNLWFAHCDTSENVAINGETQSVTVFNSRGNKKYLIDDSFDDSAISFDVEILTDDDRTLSAQEIKDIERWLFNRRNYYKLYVDIADDCYGETYQIINGIEKQFYFNCRFMNPTKIFGNGGVAGFKATMECDSHLLWQDSVEKVFPIAHTASGNTSVVSFEVDSDMNEYIYPKVTITMADAGGDISITNNTDDSTRLTSFKSLTGGIEFMINGNLNYISGNNYIKFYDKNFIRLLPGANSISIVGAISSIKFEWENRKYL